MAKLTSDIIKQFIGNHILGSQIKFEDRLDEYDITDNDFKKSKSLFQDYKSWARQSKSKLKSSGLNIFDFVENNQSYKPLCDYGEIIDQSAFNQHILNKTINNCILRKFYLSKDLGEYHQDYIISVLSDTADQVILAWFANAD